MTNPALARGFPAGISTILLAISASIAPGDITYTLQFDPSSSPEAQQVADSVATAADLYNRHGSFNKHWDVHHNPGIPTAEANYGGYMGYGGHRSVRVALHEGGHTLGMGTTPAYHGLIAGGVWRGEYGNQVQFDTYNDYQDGLHGDGHAIWPGGLNYENEDGFLERIWHVRIMAAMRADMGIMAFTEEAGNELVHPGGTAVFRVESPVATGFQWHKDGVPLPNRGGFSGANTATLRIADARSSDEGRYHCAATGAGETLDSRARQLWVDPAEEAVRLDFDGDALDSANSHHGNAVGSPAYAPGKIGEAVDLDGVDDRIELPAAAVMAKDITVAAWVRWDGGGDWQRVFDFGTGIHQNLFLTPRSGDGTMRLSIKDAINGVDTEYQVNAPALPAGEWVHLAAVLEGDRATLYVDGRPVGSNFGVPVDPIDFLPANNYIGGSQYPDPPFDGRIDDFRIYNHALGGAEVWELGAESANRAPVFDADPIAAAPATIGERYADPASLGDFANDADGDALSFTKLHGPDWLSVTADGTLSGVPDGGDAGENTFFVRVEDASGASSDARVRVAVRGTVGYWNFEEGTADAYAPYGPSSAGQYDGGILDRSGSGNHLSVWGDDWHRYRAEVPRATTPATGGTNTLSIENANGFPAISAIGTSLTSWNPTEWTIEAAIRPDDATAGYQTFVGRDSQGAFAGEPELAALYFLVLPDGTLRINFTDAAGNNWNLDSSANAVSDAEWHAVAATSDGDTLSLFLKNLTDGDPGYEPLGTLTISPSADPSLSTGRGDGGDWDAGVFSISRGLYNGGHTDRFFGHIDDVRFTEGALGPDAFLYSEPSSPAEEWRTMHFGTPDDAGGAADDADPDGDRLVNLIERALGTDPTAPEPDEAPAIDESGPRFSLTYTESKSATDLTITVMESPDLSPGSWTPATGTETAVSEDAEAREIRFTRPAGTDHAVFLRLLITEG